MTASHIRPASRAASAPQRRMAWTVRPLVLALACMGAPAIAQLPTGFNRISGSVTAPSTVGNTMSLTQTSDRAIVQWGTFSIGKDNVVNIAQPGAGSIMLNRVTGGELSTIAGSLNANGKIFLINPSGVLFGGGSTVNTGGLVASTLNITDADFNAGRYDFARADGNAAAVTNFGRLSAPGGTIALMAATVSNGGTIVADGGTVGLVAARKVSLDFQGDGLTTFRVDAAAQASAALAENQQGGTLQANGGRVAIIADSAQVAQRVVNQQGVVRAQSMIARNGEIVLGGGANDVEVGGTLDASGQDAGTSGGTIQVNAGRATLDGNALLDARGAAGGGAISVTAANGVAMKFDAALRADATGAGNGGSIRIDAATGGVDVVGQLSANAAGQGNGGSIVTSGAIVIAQGPDVSAAGAGSGANGNWTVQSQTNVVLNDETQRAAPPRVNGYIDPSDLSQVNVQPLAATLGKRTDVTVSATGTPLAAVRADSGSVLFDDAVNLVKQTGEASSLTINATRHITMSTGSSIESNAGALNVDFNADAGGTALIRRPGGSFPSPSAPPALAESGGAIRLTNATLSSNGGNIRFYGQSDPNGGAATGGTGYSAQGVADTFGTGIDLLGSSLSTCADVACTAGAGLLALSGRGLTLTPTDSIIVGATGVNVAATTLQTAAGNLSVTGVGGVGASGLRIVPAAEDALAVSSLRSGSGSITVTGSAAASTQDDVLPGLPIAPGVYMEGAQVIAGGDVVVDGTGANLDSLTNSDIVQKMLGEGTIGPAHGVYILNSDIAAGSQRSVRITGTPGSAGITGSAEGVPTVNPAYGVIIGSIAPVTSGPAIAPAHALSAAGGSVQIIGRGGNVLIAGLGGTLGIDVDSAAGMGGRAEISGSNVGMLGNTVVGARGATGGGVATVSADGVVLIDRTVQISADALAGAGSAGGGEVSVLGTQGVRAYGTLTARGANGGDGGRVETSGGGLDLRGVTVDASSAAGKAGTWVVDPYNLSIEHGAAAGTLTGLPFDAVATSVIQDGDINDALNSGTNVTIGTGTGGAPTDGRITILAAVDIHRITGATPLTLELDAHRDIIGNDFTLRSTGDAGPLNVVFNSNANNTQAADGSIQLTNAILQTNGGNVSLHGQSDALAGVASSTGGPGISLVRAQIDTRATQTGAVGGGAVTLRGAGSGGPSVTLYSSAIQSASGDVTIRGVANAGGGDGVEFGGDAGQSDFTNIATTTGNILITGIGNSDGSSSPTGTRISATNIGTVDGTIDVRGRANGAAVGGDGVVMEDASLVVGGTGRVTVAGESAGGGAGINLQGGTSGSPYMIDGGAQAVVLRADNNGGGDAIVMDGAVRSLSTIDLRPGGVDALGNAGDHVATAIALGAPGGNGFALSAAEMARLQAADIVVGSNTHAGNIVVDGAIAVTPNLSLQNEGGGSISLNAGVQAAKIALLSAGDITQAGTGPGVVGTALLARSANGNVALAGTGNNVATVAGSAAGDFRYANGGSLLVGTMAVVGFDAAVDQSQGVAGSGIAGNSAIVQSRTGNLTVDAGVVSATDTTLQAEGGAIALNVGVQGDTVALLAGGNVTQATGAPVTANRLLARSATGDVILGYAANNTQVVAGGAGGTFRYVDADALTIDTVSATSLGTAGLPQTVSAGGVNAGTTQVQARTGDLAVNAATSGTAALALQADAGALVLNATVQGNSVALLANGDISQAATGAGIVAPQLLARSTAGNVVLADATNNAGTIAGSAPGSFRYVDADALVIGTVTASALDAAGNVVPVAAAGIHADTAAIEARSANLTVDAATTAVNGLTLQADAGSLTVNAALQAGTAALQAGGNVNLNQAVQANAVALLAGGDIEQTTAAPVTAGQLLARSSGGDVILGNAANNVQVLAGGAAGSFLYTDADALAIGAVSATAPTASGAPQTFTAAGVAADVTRVQARTGDLPVNAATSGSSVLSLQADAGALVLAAPVQGSSVALLADGNISQAATGAAITAPQLLARSAAGSVVLADATNNAATIAGSAPASFRYVDADTLSIATVTASALDAAGNVVPVSAAGIVAADAAVQARTGNLSVDAAATIANGLVLQADAGSLAVNAVVQAGTAALQAAGNISLNQAVQGGTVALLAGGNITQAAGAPLTANQLLADSSAGDVILDDAANDTQVVAGSAAGVFRYIDANGLAIGSVAANAVDAAGAAWTANASGIGANDAVVATRSGDLAVNADVTAADALTLQADAGALALNAGVRAMTLGLFASGDVIQTGSGPAIVANTLLARSDTGNVYLIAGNDVATLAGSAAGDFRYADVNGLSVGTTSAMPATAGSTAPQMASGVTGNAVIVRTQTGNLAIDAASSATTGLTLQADTGAVALSAGVQANTVALLAGTDVTQLAGAPVTAGNLLARAGTGKVGLDAAANDVQVVAGSAAQAYTYTDSNALTIGSVSATSVDAAGAAQPVSASGIGATASTLRTLAGDLTLAADVTGGTADLVAAALFQNPAGASINTSGPWRVWADTWIGESRGGLGGSGTLPNLYNRSYGATAPAADNHFIYRQQPTVTVTFDNASRPAGLADPAFGYQLSGLVLGDTGAGISGTGASTASPGSPAGSYAIAASAPFVSAEGYAINIVPGILTVSSYAIPNTVDVVREMPTTYTFDRNIAPVAMCFATGPLTADKAEQTGDVLAREWARVRARPNLTNCVSTDRSNACSNF